MLFHCIVEREKLSIIDGSPCQLFSSHQICQREQDLEYTVQIIAILKHRTNQLTVPKRTTLVVILIKVIELFLILRVLVLWNSV